MKQGSAGWMVGSVTMMVCALLALPPSVAAQDVIISNNFDNASLQDWTAAGGASLYTYSGEGTDYSASTPNAADLPKSGGNIYLTNPLPLATKGYESITISFNYKRMNATTTRFLVVEYTSDGGETYTELCRKATGSNGVLFSASITLIKDEDHSVTGDMSILNTGYLPAFTDTANFRFSDSSSAAADVRSFIDDIVITAEPEWVAPPPAGTVLIVQ